MAASRGIEDRQMLFRRLERRNRLVSILRIGVPILGALILVVLAAQIVISSLGSRFGIGQISITPEAVMVEAPEYAGVMDDGSNYRVSAISARASMDHADIIDLAEASVVLNRIDGVQMQAEAPRAQLDVTQQQVLVSGIVEISDSTGTMGTLRDSVFDWPARLLTTRGPVEIDYADGTKVRAEGMVYDAHAASWTFSRAIVTLTLDSGD